jgi:hypothetical protein
MTSAPLKKPIIETGLRARIAGLASREARAKLAINNAPRQEPATPSAPEAESEISIDAPLSAARWEILLEAIQ